MAGGRERFDLARAWRERKLCHAGAALRELRPFRVCLALGAVTRLLESRRATLMHRRYAHPDISARRRNFAHFAHLDDRPAPRPARAA